MKKPAIPPVPRTSDKARSDFDRAVKERLELLTGERLGKIDPLRADASLAAVILKINEILETVQ